MSSVVLIDLGIKLKELKGARVPKTIPVLDRLLASTHHAPSLPQAHHPTRPRTHPSAVPTKRRRPSMATAADSTRIWAGLWKWAPTRGRTSKVLRAAGLAGCVVAGMVEGRGDGLAWRNYDGGKQGPSDVSRVSSKRTIGKRAGLSLDSGGGVDRDS